MVTDNTSQADDTTAFLRAARSGNLEKVIEFLNTELDINTANSNGLNALHLASKDGHVEIVTELLKRGAKVDAATKKGNTALHIASLAGQEEIVNILIQYGAAVNIQSQNGFTPLYMAAQENHDQVVKLLLSNGANQSLATEDGFTPLAVAMQQGHDKVVSVLLENDSKGKVRLPALHIAAKKDDCKAADLLLQNDHKPDVTSKSGFTPLHIAAHYGNEEIARLLIKRGADVNYLAKHNISPLHVAAKWGKNNMVKVLLENFAQIDAKTRDGLTPLHCAARSGHEQVITTLLEHSAPISAQTKNGLAPLHMASQGDHVDAARVLLYHRAPVDEITIDYLTSLHVAAHCGHVRVAKLLLDRKADPNARALNSFTPLHIACKKNRIKVVELLLKHGASIKSTTESGLTPLHVASFMGCMNIVIFLLQHEANPDVSTIRGETPLHLAARANQTDIIRILLRNGAQVDARAREQQTPLHIASRLGNIDIVMLLLQHGAAVDTTTKDMYTALHIASKEGQEEVAAILVENNASLNATTKNGFTPLHIAAKYGNMSVAKILLQRNSMLDVQGKNDISPLHLACHYDHPNVANLLLEKGASPHLASQNGHTPLHIAARKNQMDIASTLLENGAKANAESKAGFTPLHLSAQKGHYDMTNLLIEHGADPNHKSKNGLTALHLCAQEDFIRVASILVKNGANVESETETGYRPIHVAAHFGNLSMIRFLLKHNADINVKTNQSYTPLHQAAQQGHAHIVTALIEGNASHKARTNDGLTALNIAQKLGYISVTEALKGLSYDTLAPDNKNWDEKYKVIAPESLQETSFMSDSDDEGGSDALISEQPYRYLTADLMKSLRDDSLPIDVTRDDPIHRQVTKEGKQEFAQSNNYCLAENFETEGYNLGRLHFRSFLVSFLVDARGGAMKGCRHSGVRIIVPPRRATMPIRVTCRLIKPSKVANPPPLMEGEALATRIIEMGPIGATFLGPVLIDIPHFASIRGKGREIIILRSENGETWKEHDNSIDNDDTLLNTPYDPQMSATHSGRITRIITTDFPQYFAAVTRIKQEVHVIGAEGGILISSVANHVQAVFPPGALTKKIKVGLQAHVIPAELTAKLLGNCVAVSPVITIEPRRRKFHKPITLTIPVPEAANKGMINQYGGETPTLRLLCSIAGGTSESQWEDVTGSTPLTFMDDRVSFTTTVSARFWLMDCRNIGAVSKMATELYEESLYVPYIINFVIYTKRTDVFEATLRILCMTDGKEGMHTLERQEEFVEIVKSRDVEALDGKDLYIEFSGNLVPVTKSGVQLKFTFKAFRQNRLSFHVKVKDPLLDPVARMLFMREPKVAKGEPPQQPICVLNIVLPESTTKIEDTKKLKDYEDSNIIDQKLDAYESKYKGEQKEKRDELQETSPSEKKFITDTLQKERTDAVTIHESLAQKAASPLESVDASYPSKVVGHEQDLSPTVERQTYSEKRKFWEDISKKRESYQRSESDVSRTSEITVNESDSLYVQNVVTEDTTDVVPQIDKSETMEDLNVPDISECSVAEKAHYFEEQIQKEMTKIPTRLHQQLPLKPEKEKLTKSKTDEKEKEDRVVEDLKEEKYDERKDVKALISEKEKEAGEIMRTENYKIDETKIERKEGDYVTEKKDEPEKLEKEDSSVEEVSVKEQREELKEISLEKVTRIQEVSRKPEEEKLEDKVRKEEVKDKVRKEEFERESIIQQQVDLGGDDRKEVSTKVSDEKEEKDEKEMQKKVEVGDKRVQEESGQPVEIVAEVSVEKEEERFEQSVLEAAAVEEVQKSVDEEVQKKEEVQKQIDEEAQKMKEAQKVVQEIVKEEMIEDKIIKEEVQKREEVKEPTVVVELKEEAIIAVEKKQKEVEELKEEIVKTTEIKREEPKETVKEVHVQEEEGTLKTVEKKEEDVRKVPADITVKQEIEKVVEIPESVKETISEVSVKEVEIIKTKEKISEPEIVKEDIIKGKSTGKRIITEETTIIYKVQKDGSLVQEQVLKSVQIGDESGKMETITGVPEDSEGAKLYEMITSEEIHKIQSQKEAEEKKVEEEDKKEAPPLMEKEEEQKPEKFETVLDKEVIKPRELDIKQIKKEVDEISRVAEEMVTEAKQVKKEFESRIPISTAKMDKSKAQKDAKPKISPTSKPEAIKDIVLEKVDTVPVTTKKKEFESQIPKRVIDTKPEKSGQKDTHVRKESETYTITEKKSSEEVTTKLEQQSTTKSETQTFSKIFTDPQDAFKMFENLDSAKNDYSTVTSKIDQKTSSTMEKKEVKSSEIHTGTDKIITHEEKERVERKKSSESQMKKESPTETLEEKKSKREELDKTAVQKMSMNLTDKEEIIDASASESRAKTKEEKTFKKLSDKDGVTTHEAGSSTVQESDADVAIRIKKDISEEASKKDDIKVFEEEATGEKVFEPVSDSTQVEKIAHAESHKETKESFEVTQFSPKEKTSEEKPQEDAIKKIEEQVPEVESLEERQRQKFKEIEARTIAETLIQSIESELEAKSAESLKTELLTKGYLEQIIKEGTETDHEKLADELTRKFENIMKKLADKEAEKSEASKDRTSLQEESYEKSSTRDSISEDMPKDEESSLHEKEDSYPLSSSQARMLDRDITMSPSSMSEQIDFEETMDVDTNELEDLSKPTLSPQSEKQRSDRSGKDVELKGDLQSESFPQDKMVSEISGARVLEILEPGAESQSRQDSVDVPSLEMDEHKVSEQTSRGIPSLRESADTDSFEKMARARDITISPSTVSEDTNVDSSLVQEAAVSVPAQREHEPISTRRTDSFEIESPPMMSPKLKVQELEIKPVSWMIGEKKIEISETLQPSQIFNQELEEFESMRKKERLSSQDGSVDYEQESGTKSSEEISVIESMKDTCADDGRVSESVSKEVKPVTQPISEQDFDSEFVENKSDVNSQGLLQELVDLLQRASDEKTSIEGYTESHRETVSETAKEPEKLKKEVPEMKIEKTEVKEAEVEETKTEKTEVDKVEVEKTTIGKAEIEKVDIEKLEVEKEEVVKTEAEKAEVVKTDAEKAKVEKIELKKPEIEKLEIEKAEVVKTDAEKVDIEKLEVEKAEVLKTEAEKAEVVKREAEKAEVEKTEAKKAKVEKTEAEKAKIEKIEVKETEIEKLETEKAAVVKTEDERAEVLKTEAEKAEVEKTEAEKAKIEKTEAEKAKVEKIEVKKTEIEKLETEKAEVVKTEAERAEVLKTEAGKAEVVKREAEKAEVEKTEAEKAKVEKIEVKKTEIEKLEFEKAEVVKTDAEIAEVKKIEVKKTEIEKTEVEKVEKEEKKKIEVQKMEIEEAKEKKIEIEKMEIKKTEEKEIKVQKTEIEKIGTEKAEIEKADIEKEEDTKADAEKAKVEETDIEKAEVEETKEHLSDEDKGEITTTKEVTEKPAEEVSKKIAATEVSSKDDSLKKDDQKADKTKPDIELKLEKTTTSKEDEKSGEDSSQETDKATKMDDALKEWTETYLSKMKPSGDDYKRHIEKTTEKHDKSGKSGTVPSSTTCAFKIKDYDPNADLSVLYAITVLDQMVKKEIAEVKESLEAAKQDLIEELSENSETVIQIKDSPSEFQFKLQPESIPNDLPFLYKPPSPERDVETTKSESPPAVASQQQEPEAKSDSKDGTETKTGYDESPFSSFEEPVHKEAKPVIVTEKSDAETAATVQDDSTVEEEERPSPILASRSGSDVENKDDSVSLALPRPVLKRRHKPSRGSKRVTSESEADVGSSSGDSSNYQSCDYEIGSGSRPSSSDMEALHSCIPSATVSEYETAVMSIDSSSKPTSQEYHTAATTISSRESMKSLASLSSGHLGSIDNTSELSETLVASEVEDEDQEEIEDEKLSGAFEDEHTEQSDSSGSDIPIDESMDKIDSHIPYRMKRSSEMIFPQVLEGDAAIDEERREPMTKDAKGVDFATSTASPTSGALQSVDIMTSRVSEDGIQSVCTQVISVQATMEAEAPAIMSERKVSDPDTLEKDSETVSDTQMTESDYPGQKSISGFSSESPEMSMQTSTPSIIQQTSMSTSSASAVSVSTVVEKDKLDRRSPDSDSFEMIDKPDIIDDFIVIEEVGREAEEYDSEGKSILISSIPQVSSKHYDRDLENLITETKDDAQATASQPAKTNDLFDFESEESPPQASNDDQYSQSYSDEEQYEGSKKWIEMQFHADPRVYDIEYDRVPLEDIKEEEITDFEAGSSRFGSLGSHKESIGSVGSMRGSFGSTPDYDILAGKKYFVRPSDHDNVSLSSLQEFENLESAVAAENSRKLQQCGSHDSVNNGSLPRRYMASRSGHGDDISLSSLKDFEGLEKACKEAHLIELRAREEEDLLEHESPENKYKLESLSRTRVDTSTAGSFNPSTSGSDDYEKRIKEIDEIIRIAQTNVERFDRQDDTTEDISQIEIMDTERTGLPAPVQSILKQEELKDSNIQKEGNIMETSTDSLELEDNMDKKHHPLCRSSDSLEMKTTLDFPSLSSDSLNNVRDGKEAPSDVAGYANNLRRISSDSLDMPLMEQQNIESQGRASEIDPSDGAPSDNSLDQGLETSDSNARTDKTRTTPSTST